MKRTKVPKKCANPLFEEWLTEWREEAVIQRKEKLQLCFTRAISSLRKYPLPLARGKDCIILQYFGPKVCTMLDKRLDQHLKVSNIDLQTLDSDDESGNTAPKKSRKDNKPKKNNDSKNGKVTSERPFIPKSGSASHSLLIALYRKSLTPDYAGYMNKAELQREAQPFSDCSLTKSFDDSFYTGWSSMSTLTEKGLVLKTNSPARYSLTDSGLALAKALSEKEQPESSETILESSFLGKENAEPDLLLEKPREHAFSAFALNYCNTEDHDIPMTSKVTSNEEVEIIDLDIYEEMETRSSSMSLEPSIFDPTLKNVIEWPKKITHESEKELEKPSQTEPKTKINVNGKQKKSEKVPETSGPIFILEPNSFDVILLVDVQETSGKAKQKDDATIAELNQFKVQFEIRHLKVGDFAWIARCRKTNNELILPHIVERKRIDDLDKSIQDGRFHEQKFRLKQSGIKNLIYMVESYGKNVRTGIPLKSLLQAAVNSLVQDGFILKLTNDHKNSMMYLATLTDLLRKVYSKKRLSSGEKENLDSVDLCNDSEPLMEFNKFNKSSSKVKILKVKEMLVRQLLQIKGISLEKALAIVELYPTPKLLFSALNKAGGNGEKLLAPLQYGLSKRQIGPACSKIIYQFYTQRVLN
ncbi:crossover junction endonuclease MUS81 [Belonocnema kinseyi]|uniref:crossover junction endonuclease MUS81 n=1 Tax=Belonocnema kinseyi TaxID=2817044 RepID=UPI00143D425E|nr:crossover junction endonuclease MUS81 [Belonocnema kinseyi]